MLILYIMDVLADIPLLFQPGYFEAIGEFIRDEVWKLVNGSMESEKKDDVADKAPIASVENGGENREKDGM